MFRIFATAIFVVMIFAANSMAEETWKIATLNWEPYSGAEMATQGNSIQKLRLLLKKEKINLIVDFYPWKRAQIIARNKEYVGYFPAWPEEVYEGFTASPTVDWSEIGILKNTESSLRFESVDDLFKNYKVGIIQTYTYPKVIDDAVKKYPNHTEKAPNEISLLRKLATGRHPAAITDPTVMMYLAARNGIYNVETVKIIMKKELVVAFRDDEDNKDRINFFRKLLKGM
ncbi:transporter substrate-binding domain-containing protein [uncultured Desulfosarcina sp.]|uniref:transporter substrate-binding domain-containing protein n=1 Tax=uncultured Desulfosarcina sp. TaxID=218289 RepID=UPI0029C88375|nr:transporter substrate-binding domain-containing protein [uncultured Desulfosarcina sp.]